MASYKDKTVDELLAMSTLELEKCKEEARAEIDRVQEHRRQLIGTILWLQEEAKK